MDSLGACVRLYEPAGFYLSCIGMHAPPILLPAPAMDVPAPETPSRRDPGERMLPRVRLRRKTAPPSVSNPSQAPGWRLAPRVSPSQAPAESASRLSKKKLVSLYHYWWRKRVNWHALPRWQQLKQAGRFNLRAQPAEERRRLLALFRAAHPHRAEEIEDFTAEWCPPNLASKILVMGESFLLTYQGDWGIIPVSGLDAGTVMRAMRLMTNERARQVVQAELGRSCPSQAPDPASAWQRADPDAAFKSVDIVAEAARAHPRTAACVEALLQRLATFRERRKVVHDAWAAEVCGRSWLEAGQVRVHLHLALCLRAGSREPVNMENERVMDTLPFLTTPALGQGARARNASAALYYVQAPKVRGSFAKAARMSPTWITLRCRLGYTGYLDRASCCSARRERRWSARRRASRGIWNPWSGGKGRGWTGASSRSAANSPSGSRT